MPQDLDALLETVRDEDSFRVFLSALAADFEEDREIAESNPSNPSLSGPLGWEHGTIDGYLGAASVCGAIKSPAERTDIESVWFRCAAILHSAKYYE